jgi:hypothetical protein
MKPVALIRRENLRRLIDQEFDGKGAALAERMGRDRRNGTKQVSAWLNHKEMRDSTAREIELACLKPSGWLDHEANANLTLAAQAGPESHSVRTDRQKMADAIRLLKELAELQGVPDLVSDPDAISLAYDFLVAFETPLTESNVLDMTKRLAAKIRGEKDATTERSSAA